MEDNYSTIGEVFADFKKEINPQYHSVTLEQLFAHRGGIPSDSPNDLWLKAWEAKGTPTQQRLVFIKGILARKPEANPGTKFIYSNPGYSIAGVMLEKVTGKAWEELMHSLLFEPLGMKSAGFGAPASINQVDQPWGHLKKMFLGNIPVPSGPQADNPPASSPAGAVHCSLSDLVKYALFHMTGERGEGRILKTETFKKLHTPVDGNAYALGWFVLPRKWAHGPVLMHNGSNTTFYVVVWIAPNCNCAVIVAANIGIDAAFAGCDEAVGKMIEKFFPK